MSRENKNEARSIKSLLACYDPNTVKNVKKLEFKGGVENRDVYNITPPFKIKRTWYLAGRVEMRDDELGTKIVFFKRGKGQRMWRVIPLAPVFNLQDPFVSKIKGSWVLGGVQTKQKGKNVRFRTLFYRGKDIDNLTKFARGPWGMKDIRLVELENKKIGVFTRPRGGKRGRGKIGFRVVDYLKDIRPRMLSRVEVIDNMFARGEWGGVNEVHVLKNNKLGVLGHIAKFKKDNGVKKRYYYPITFLFDPETKEFSHMKILVSRKDLPEGEAKRDDLYYVIFPGGIRRKENGRADLYAGVSDAESYRITIKDPFKEYEKIIEEEMEKEKEKEKKEKKKKDKKKNGKEK